jgi:hypothetical protein
MKVSARTLVLFAGLLVIAAFAAASMVHLFLRSQLSLILLVDAEDSLSQFIFAKSLSSFIFLLVSPLQQVNVEDAQCLAGGVRKACALALISQSACEANGCCWAPTAYDPTGTACPNGSGVPACFLPNPPVKGTPCHFSFAFFFAFVLFLPSSFLGFTFVAGARQGTA